MERVQNAINQTGLGTAKVKNPWPTVMERGVTTEDILQPPKDYAGKVQEPIPFGVPLKNLRIAEKTKLASALGSEKLAEANYSKALKKVTEDYVEASKANYRNLKNDNCTLFACCTIGMLAQNPKLLPEGIRVELFNLTESTGGQPGTLSVKAATDDDKKF